MACELDWVGGREVKQTQWKGVKRRNDKTELQILYTSLEIIPVIRK